MKTSEKNTLMELVKSLPSRVGDKPQTIGPAPHQQISQFPEMETLADELHRYVMSFDRVENGVSHIGDGGLRAYFISGHKQNGFSDRFLVDNEFAHIHRHKSYSLHLALPPEIGKISETKGWTENHPLAVAGRIPTTNYMLFGARSSEELEVAKVLLRISYLYATDNWQ